MLYFLLSRIGIEGGVLLLLSGDSALWYSDEEEGWKLSKNNEPLLSRGV